MTIKALIKGSAGTTMIDGTWRSMSFASKRTLPAFNRGKIDRYDDYAIWAYRCTLKSGDVLGGMFTTSWLQAGSDILTKDYYSSSASMELYEFADLTIERDPIGLNIKNELGILIFSSKMKPLCVIHHQSGLIPSGSTSSEVTLFDSYLPSDRKYAVMIGDAPSLCNARSDGVSMRSLVIYTGDDGRVVVKYALRVFPTETGGYRGEVLISRQYSFQIIDVTGY